MHVYTNHMGYNARGSKKAVFQGEEGVAASAFRVLDQAGKTVYEGVPAKVGTVANWRTGYYWTLDFTPVEALGAYTIEVDTALGAQRSLPFEIAGCIRDMRLLNAVSYYFKAQRNTGEWEEADKHLAFQGDREGVLDVHGGWCDASGDYGIHMTHLSHTTVGNPQQASFSAYVFFKLDELLSHDRKYSMLRRRVLDEGTYGADFIMRMRAPSGSFLRSVQRQNSYEPSSDNRMIGLEYTRSSGQFTKDHSAPTADTEVITDANYETSMRAGGGTCIAALAAAARHPYPGSDFHTDEYLAAAKKAFAYLMKHNEMYLNDGEWNLIDEFCALLAAAELYKTSGEIPYLLKANAMAERMFARIEDTGDGGLWFTSRPGEPFYHAADEGLPVVALLTLAQVDKENGGRYVEVAEKAMRHVLRITQKVNNPFGYARYYHKTVEGERAEKFFFYHESPAAPWWQGDNARIASLAAAAWMLALHTEDGAFAEELNAFAQDQINWILGLNPFDACMIEGYGHNNIQYSFRGHYEFISCPGGICNGITSRPDDEEGIFFLTEPTEEINDNWRWAEQWIPHGTWFLYAMALSQQVKARRTN